MAIGRLRPGVEADLFAHYNARLRPPITMIEIPEKGGRAAEGAALLAALTSATFVVALDPAGAAFDSLAFAEALQSWGQSWGRVHFVIGGAEGLDRRVIERADVSVSLGQMTWPHLLVRGLLAEQIFRARCIAAGHPYHRA